MAGSGRHLEPEHCARAPEGAARSPRRDRPEVLASAIGNRAFATLIGRSAAGIMQDGTVHPEIEETIARTRGAGSALDASVRERFAPQLGDSFSDVRVHADAGADALAQSVSARAFTTGSDIFFATGEYRPGSSDGGRLLAHELTHVVQQRGAPTSGPMVVSAPSDALELEAESVAHELAG